MKDLVERKAAILKAISHPVRLSIVEELSKGERCACELASLFPVDRTTVSKHLALLRRLGIVEDRKDGLKIYYRLRMSCLVDLLRCLDGVLANDARCCDDSGERRKKR